MVFLKCDECSHAYILHVSSFTVFHLIVFAEQNTESYYIVSGWTTEDSQSE